MEELNELSDLVNEKCVPSWQRREAQRCATLTGPKLVCDLSALLPLLPLLLEILGRVGHIVASARAKAFLLGSSVPDSL